MKYRIYQIDAFTDKVFYGNPAAVCPLEKWISDDLLQKIEMENNLAETAFFVKRDNEYQIRCSLQKQKLTFADTQLFLLLTFYLTMKTIQEIQLSFTLPEVEN